MYALEEADIYCPYCGERISVLVDSQEVGQDYIEDCQVCCRPIVFKISYDETGSVTISAYSENDVY